MSWACCRFSRSCESRGRSLLLGLTACLALASLAGCGGLGTPAPRSELRAWPQIRADFRGQTLRLRLQEYSITFGAQVDHAAASIDARSADAAVRRNALLWRLRSVAEMRKACFRTGPLGGLIDAWTLARQMDQLFSTGAGATAFGRFQPEAIEVSQRLLAQLHEVASSIAVSDEARDRLERDVIDPWVAMHPLPDMTFVRESPVARFAEYAAANADVFQSVGSMEELFQSVAQQARLYLADLPRQVRGEIDLLRADVLATDTLASAWADLHASAVAVDGLGATAASLPAVIREEREAVLDEMNRQRAFVMGAVTTEREELIREMADHIALERRELLREVQAQRLATLQWASGERAVLTEEARHLIDMVFLRLALFVGAGIALAPLIAQAYARVWPRNDSRWAQRDAYRGKR